MRNSCTHPYPAAGASYQHCVSSISLSFFFSSLPPLSLYVSFEQKEEKDGNFVFPYLDESTHGYVQEAQLRGEVERGVALICEIWVL